MATMRQWNVHKMADESGFVVKVAEVDEGELKSRDDCVRVSAVPRTGCVLSDGDPGAESLEQQQQQQSGTVARTARTMVGGGGIIEKLKVGRKWIGAD